MDRAVGTAAGVGGGVEEIGAPFPHVADRLPEAERVGGERADRWGGHPAVLRGVDYGEPPLPDVAPPGAVRPVQLVAPRVAGALDAAAGGAFPFGLGGQP